jgi:hypothetical protein
MTDQTVAGRCAGFLGELSLKPRLAPRCIDETARKSPGAFEIFYENAETR